VCLSASFTKFRTVTGLAPYGNLGYNGARCGLFSSHATTGIVEIGLRGAQELSNSTEARTRVELIDPALKKAGWDVNDLDLVGVEIPVDGFDPQAWRALEAELGRLAEAGIPYQVELPQGVSDYALYRENGEVLAVVEAKKTSIDPRFAVPQPEFYVTEIEKRQAFRPFAFMTNGHDTYFWDVGRAAKRQVYGFFSRADLENLLYIRQNQRPLTRAPRTEHVGKAE